MKKLLLSISVVATMVACSSKEKTEAGREMVILQDSSALYQNNVNTDRAAMVQEEEAEARKVTPKKYVKTNIVRKNTNRPQPVYTEPVQQTQPSPPVVTTPPIATPAETASTSESNAGNNETGASTGTETTTDAQKKTGISKAAKGAVIGAGAGAVAGAIIGKNAKGAIIGAVLGAGGGYVLGRKQDKKDGRIE